MTNQVLEKIIELSKQGDKPLKEEEFKIEVPENLVKKYQYEVVYKRRKYLDYINNGFVDARIFNKIDLPPSAVRWKITKDYRVIYAKIRDDYFLVPLNNLIESPKYNGAMVVTKGIITSHNPSDMFILEDKKALVTCKYRKHSSTEHWYPELVFHKLTIYENGKRIPRNDKHIGELDLFLNSFMKKKIPILVNGFVDRDMLLVDVFGFNQNHFFEYLCNAQD